MERYSPLRSRSHCSYPLSKRKTIYVDKAVILNGTFKRVEGKFSLHTLKIECTVLHDFAGIVFYFGQHGCFLSSMNHNNYYYTMLNDFRIEHKRRNTLGKYREYDYDETVEFDECDRFFRDEDGNIAYV